MANNSNNKSGKQTEESRNVDFRMDFMWEDVQIDDKTGKFSARLVPDPRRYEWVKKEDGQYLFDKMDNVYFPPGIIDKMLEQAKGMPINFQQRRFENIDEYFFTRAPLIDAGIVGKAEEIEQADVSDDFLANLKKNKHEFVIMCVDLAGSTKLAHSIDQDQYVNVIRTLSRELGDIVHVFRGHILKYTGDGIIAYFPAPSLITMNDLCFDCSLSMMYLVDNIFSPICMQHSIPKVRIRIGIDSGQASVITIGSSSTMRQKDIIGKIINIAAKIQSLGSPGDVMVGETARRITHTMWRVGLDEITLPENWQYTAGNGLPYKVYRIRKGFKPQLAPEELDSDKDV